MVPYAGGNPEKGARNQCFGGDPPNPPTLAFSSTFRPKSPILAEKCVCAGNGAPDGAV